MLPNGTSVRLLGVFAGLTAFCEALGFYAAALYAFAQTRSTLAVSLVMASVAIAETVGAVLGGTLADRLDRKRLACLAALAAGLLLLVLVLGANIVVLSLVLVLATLISSPIRPVIGASLPNLVGAGEDLESANGYVQGLRNVAMTLAPVVTGLGVSVVGARGIFLIAGVSLLVAAVVLACIRGDFSSTSSDPRQPVVSESWLEGFAYLRRDRVLAVVVAAGAFSMLVAACGLVADLPFALHDLHLNTTGYGILVATWGGGMAVGSLSAAPVMRRFGPARAFGVTLALEGVGIAAAAIAPGAWIAGVAFVAGGIAGGWCAVADQLIVQERVPDAARGRVRAANDALIAASYSTSLGFGGLIVALLGARGTYGLAAVGCLIAGAAASIALRRSPDAYGDALEAA